MKQEERIYFQRGTIKVTDRFLRTRYKDEPLNPSLSFKIGRDPLWISGIIGLGLTAFSYQFGDLLFFWEQVALAVFGVGAVILGFCLASLQIGQFMQERTVLWGPIWTISTVRNAIFESNHDRENQGRETMLIDDEVE